MIIICVKWSTVTTATINQTTQQQNTQTPSFLVRTKQYDLSKGAQLDISNRIKVFHIIFHCNAIQLQPFERGKQR